MTKIKEYLGGENTVMDPRKLQQAAWFVIAFNTGCRGREIYRQLRKDSLAFTKDDRGEAYFTIEQSVVEKITMEDQIPNSSGRTPLASMTASWGNTD